MISGEATALALEKATIGDERTNFQILVIAMCYTLINTKHTGHREALMCVKDTNNDVPLPLRKEMHNVML